MSVVGSAKKWFSFDCTENLTVWIWSGKQSQITFDFFEFLLNWDTKSCMLSSLCNDWFEILQVLWKTLWKLNLFCLLTELSILLTHFYNGFKADLFCEKPKQIIRDYCYVKPFFHLFTCRITCRIYRFFQRNYKAYQICGETSII